MSAEIVPAVTAPQDHPLPIVGEWYWIKFPSRYDGDEATESLMYCKAHGSNHAKFVMATEHNPHGVRVLFTEWHRWTHEPKWKELFQAEIDAKQIELREAIAALAGEFTAAKVLPQQGSATPSTALVTGGPSVEEQKAQLLHLKKSALPAIDKSVKEITKEMVIAHKHLFLPEIVKAQQFAAYGKAIEDKLFALELYAGFGESLCQIQDGKPADRMEPIRIHQMIRFMDEETLIAALEGGMSFSDLEAFDEWVCQNIDAITPYPRAVVSWRVRRNRKDYGPCRDLMTAFQHLAWHEKDMETYLLIRNGSKIYRAKTMLDFGARMIPHRDEFQGEFTETSRWWSGRETEKEIKVITPEHVDYDDKVTERAHQIRHYNRIVFLLQGVLDRSEVFKPHPMIDLASEDGQRWLVPVRDEEDGLPTSLPLSFEDYRAAANQPLKKGDTVYAAFDYRTKPRSWHEKSEWRTATGLFRFEGWTTHERKGRVAKVSQGGNKRWGFENPSSQWRKGEWGEWPTTRSHYTCDEKELFRLASYTPGDYKPFLCDAHTKGAYLLWAPALVSAEKWHRKGKPELPA